jgi:hypothetical protein
MRTVRFVIGGVLGLALLGASVQASPETPSAPSVPSHQQPKAPEDMLAQAESLVSKIASQVDDNRALDNIARENRDALKSGCVDNQLAVSRALLKASQGTLTSLRTSVRSGRDVEVAPQFTMIVSLAGESDATHHAAASCLGSKEIAQKQLAAPTGIALPAPSGDKTTATPRISIAALTELRSFITISLISGRTAPASP